MVLDENIHRIQDTRLGRAKVRTKVRSRKWRKALAVVGHFPEIMFPVFHLGRRPPVEGSGSRYLGSVWKPTDSDDRAESWKTWTMSVRD